LCCLLHFISLSFHSVLCFTWCLFKSSLSSFICFCVLSCSFLVSWNFLGASGTFWLTLSNIFSMNLSMISCKISSLRLFLWTSLGYLVTFIIVLLGSGWGYPFSSFPTESSIELFFWGESFPSFLLWIVPLGSVQLCSW
jgi:hypothetical protein